MPPGADFTPNPTAWGIALILAGIGFWWIAPDWVRKEEARSRHRWPTSMRIRTLLVGRLCALGVIVAGIATIATGSTTV